MFDNGLMSKGEYWRLEAETRESSKIGWYKCGWTLDEPPKKIDVTSKLSPQKSLKCTYVRSKPKKKAYGTVGHPLTKWC